MIINTTRKKVLAKRVKECKTTLSKAKGLMFTRKRKDLGIILDFHEEKRLTLHMIFVFYPIDVLFLDSSKKVVEMKKALKPFTFYKNKKKARYVIELSQGRLSETQVGDKIKTEN